MGDAMMAASVLASPHTQLNYGGATAALAAVGAISHTAAAGVMAEFRPEQGLRLRQSNLFFPTITIIVFWSTIFTFL